MNILKKILLFISLFSLFVVSAFSGYTYYNFKNITTTISNNHDDLGIEQSSLDELEAIMSQNNFNKDEITNIALFGVDSRDSSSMKNTRSDSIIIASIDKKHNKIKLASVMRDTYVKIDGKGKDKINHAYAFGGPQLAIKTLNQNFGLDIKDFVTVNFFGLAKIIDAIGGVEVDIKKYEINEINKYITEIAQIEKKSPDLLKKEGMQKLSGAQAVSYGRIRKVGNGDYERTDRQRRILTAMINELKSISFSEMASLLTSCSNYVQTSLNFKEITQLGMDVIKNMQGFSIDQKRFPIHGEGKTVEGAWVMSTNLTDMKSDIRNFIYELSTDLSQDKDSSSTKNNIDTKKENINKNKENINKNKEIEVYSEIYSEYDKDDDYISFD